MNHSLLVISVGYEGRSPDDLVRVLGRHGVTKLLDVRALAVSRKRGFSKTPLAMILTAAGIDYCHLPTAGNPYRKERSDVDLCLGLYREYIERNPTIIQHVATELTEGSVAVLCFEREHTECHRSVLIDALKATGLMIEVVHAE